MTLATAINDVVEGRDLSREAMREAMHTIMTGGATQAQIGAFLVGLRMKGEVVDEIAAGAEVMRELSAKVPFSEADRDELVDTCGTGGDASGLFNVSTATAFVVAAAGGKVAKHGNRSVSSKSGSADVLEAAGVKLDLSPDAVAQCVRDVGVGFMFAPAFHSAMKHAIGPRKELKLRTVFNLLGPLTNPAGVRNQVLGVFDAKWLQPLAEVLKSLGSRNVLVVHSEDGLDEISIAAPTHFAELRAGKVRTGVIDPAQLGAVGPLDGLRAADAAESLALIRAALGGESGPPMDMVALNAGAALYVAGIAAELAEGVKLARQQMENGAALRKLEDLARVSQSL